jgi:hypothetical protein
MNKSIFDEDLEFNELDKALSKLGKSDSSVEYALHIRDEFDSVVSELNKIKDKLHVKGKESDEYFT